MKKKKLKKDNKRKQEKHDHIDDNGKVQLKREEKKNKKTKSMITWEWFKRTVKKKKWKEN